jgi:hypothetical protein
MKTIKVLPSLIALATALAAQPVLSSAHAQGCANVAFQGVAQVGLIEVAPGVFVLGGLPTPVVIAGVSGLLQSVVTGLRPSGSDGQGAGHYTLVHTFVSTDPARPGTFITSDQALGAPAGTDPNTAIINDVLTVVSGTGVFANASGFMMNHALLNLNDFTLTTQVRGRICADGL